VIYEYQEKRYFRISCMMYNEFSDYEFFMDKWDLIMKHY